MARALRIEYAGAVYHVMCRGNNGQDIFVSDADRRSFLRTLEESCEQTGWIVHAYVLMNNHYHILLETPEANLVAGMKWLQGTYTQRFNSINKRRGHLFQGRYKSLLIDPDDPQYFSTVSTYIHLNPIRAGLCERPADFIWSSSRIFSDPAARRPKWLCLDRVYSSLSLSGGGRTKKRLYADYINARSVEENDPDQAPALKETRAALKRGWLMGGIEFKDKMLDLMDQRLADGRDNLRGEQRRMHGEHQAEVYLKKALGAMDISEEALLALPGVSLEKRAVAWLLMKHTTVTAVWIAERLHMGHRVNVSRAVSSLAAGKTLEEVSVRKAMLQCTG